MLKFKLFLLLKNWVGQINSKIELKSNNFKKLYNIKITKIWSKAPEAPENKADDFNKDSNT